MARYLEVRETLATEIAAGNPPVNARFPTEVELCERFGVSRHTVREALRDLQDSGLLVRQRGSGTVVAAGRKPIYSQAFQSLGELDDYAKSAHFEKLSEGVVAIRPGLAELLDCPVGSKWLRIVGLRRLTGHIEPLGWTEIFIDERYMEIRNRPSAEAEPYYERLRREFGLTTTEVEQRLSAVAVPADIAVKLGVEADAPALLVRRRYFAASEAPFEVTISIHPADRYAHTARLKLDAAPRGG